MSSHARGDNAPAVPMLCASSRQRRLCRVRLVLRRQGLRSGVLCTPRLPPRLSLFSFPSLSRDHHWLFLENLLCPAVCHQRPPPIAPEVSSVPTVERRFNPSHRSEAAYTLMRLNFLTRGFLSGGAFCTRHIPSSSPSKESKKQLFFVRW